MDYWNDILTEKSWQILMRLKNENFDFIVIGGWAAYLWTKLHKSKDIDMVIKENKDLNFLKKNYDLRKNDNLKKYEVKFEEIDLDIYVPYYSKLAIPVEEIKKYSTRIQGFDVVNSEVLLILKQGAEKDREFSIKGEKDRIDIVSLILYSEIDFKEYHKLIEKYQLIDYYTKLLKIIKNFKEIKYLNLNLREFRLRKTKIIEELKKK